MVTAAAILDRIDARIALVLYLLLLLAAAAPVVLGWLALLPDEREPFAVRGEVASAKPRDYVAVFFLVNISISVLLRIPGIDSVSLTSYFSKFNWPEWAGHALMITFIWFGFVPGLAAAVFGGPRKSAANASADWRNACTRSLAGRAVAAGFYVRFVGA